MTEQHPLFPPKEEDDEIPEVCEIRVSKLMPDQGFVMDHRRFDPSEITSWGDVYDLFGPGFYTLTAYNEARQFSRKVQNKIGDVAQRGPEPAPAPAAAGPGPVPAPGMDVTLLTAFLGFMTQMQQGQTQMMTALLTAQDRNSKDFAAQMAAMSQQQNQAMGSIVTALLSRDGSGGAVKDVFQILDRGVTMGKEMAAADEEDDDDDLGDVISTVVQGAQMAGGFVNGPGGPPMGPPPQPPQPPKPAPRGNGQGAAK